MIVCKLKGYDGKEYQLPPLLTGRFSHGVGLPCDSFSVKCLWGGGEVSPLNAAVRFTAVQDGVLRFTGVVDEVCVTQTAAGRFVEVTGRGLGALLLDNEALAQEYQTATLADLVRGHVTPYGITVAPGASLPAVEGFSVASGSSEWQVVCDFARYHGGVTPRFDVEGRLVLKKPEDGGTRLLDESVPVTAMEYCTRRYGVLSQVLVRDKPRKTVETVNNEQFLREGGTCRRVMTMPGRSSNHAMRYSGGFQLESSAEKRYRLTLTVPLPFFAQPGERLQIARKGWGCDGLWQVKERETLVTERGMESVLTLYREEN
ncbi:MAG: hypothetical protein RSC08_00770 [Oscillospiraceae bacterium]